MKAGYTCLNPLLARTRPSRATTTISSWQEAPASTRAAVAHAPSATSADRSKSSHGRKLEGVQAAVGRGDRRGERWRGAGFGDPGSQRLKIDGAALRMQIKLALGELRHLGRAASDSDAVDRMGAQILEQAAGEIAHLDQGVVGQTMQEADRRLGGLAGRRADMGAAARPGDVDAAHDRTDPGRTGIRYNNAGRAEDREAPDDAEPAVGRAFRDLRAAGHGDLDDRVRRDREPRRDLLEIGADHRAGRRIDRRLARRQGQTGPRHRTDPFPRPEPDALALRAKPHGRDDQCAMRHIGIVAGILDDPGAGEIVAELLYGERELRPQPLRQRHRDGIGKGARQQRFESGARSAAGAGARRPAASQRRFRSSIAHALV